METQKTSYNYLMEKTEYNYLLGFYLHLATFDP